MLAQRIEIAVGERTYKNQGIALAPSYLQAGFGKERLPALIVLIEIDKGRHHPPVRRRKPVMMRMILLAGPIA